MTTKRKSDPAPADATSYELTYHTATFAGSQLHDTPSDVADALGQLHEELTISSFKVERIVRTDITGEFQ